MPLRSFFFFSSRRRHTRLQGDWSSDVCSSDLHPPATARCHHRVGSLSTMPRTGRRPGSGGTGEKILSAARAHFARVGYEAGTVRGIAADAGVDPSLVLHYFGSKEGLFRAAVDFPVNPADFIP